MDVSLAIAGVLDIFGRHRRDQLFGKTSWKMDAFALNIAPGVFEAFQRAGVIAELDTDLFEQDFGIAFDNGETFLVEEFYQRAVAGNVGNGDSTTLGTGCPASLAAAAIMFCFVSDIVHGSLPAGSKPVQSEFV